MRRKSRAAHSDDPARPDARKDLFGGGMAERRQVCFLLCFGRFDDDVLRHAAPSVRTLLHRFDGARDARMDVGGNAVRRTCNEFSALDRLSRLHDRQSGRARMLREGNGDFACCGKPFCRQPLGGRLVSRDMDSAEERPWSYFHLSSSLGRDCRANIANVRAGNAFKVNVTASPIATPAPAPIRHR